MVRKKDWPEVGDPTDPMNMTRQALAFIEWMGVRGSSERTIDSRTKQLKLFLDWCNDRGLQTPAEVTRPILQRYQRHLYHYRKTNGQPLSFGTQRSRLEAVRLFFRWLTRSNLILYNPASELELPRTPKRLPRFVLTASEVETVLNQPDIRDPFGLRDRAILETFYSTGIRRAELAGLELYDLDVDRGTLAIRHAKGSTDRVVPIGERAIAWIQRYLGEVRPQFVVEPDAGVLFLSHLGGPVSLEWLTSRVKEYVDQAKLGKTGSCHLFRHTMATLMLEAGADVRFIQAMLGHAKLESTQIYTRVSIRKLKEVHTAMHPARLERGDHTAELDDEEEAELLDSLAAEAAEEDDEDSEVT